MSIQKSIPYLRPRWRQNGQNWYPIYDQNGWKNLPFGAARTYIAHIKYKGVTPPPGFMPAEYSTYWISYLNTLHYIGLFICNSILRKQNVHSNRNTVTKHCSVSSQIKIWSNPQFWRMRLNFYLASLNSPSGKKLLRKLWGLKCLNTRFLNEARIR